jgi:hypothetical protein
MTTPITPTGKRKWAHRGGPSPFMNLHLDDLLAIEAEAAQQERERLRAALQVSRVVGLKVEGRLSKAQHRAMQLGWDIGLDEADDILAEPSDG